MQLSVKGKQIDVGDALRQHVESVLAGIVEKYFGRAIEAHVVFSREAHLLRADMSVHVHRDMVVQGHALAGDAYSAFDNAAERIAKRIRRHKRRLVDDHHGRNRDAAAEGLRARSYVLAAEAEEPGAEEPSESAPQSSDDGAAGEPGDQPVIVAEMTCEIPTLSVGEAVMRMDLADVPSFIFRNRTHGGLNVVYRRTDGNIGWVDPDLAAAPASRKPKS
jgi:ribosomal subunit interface protein